MALSLPLLKPGHHVPLLPALPATQASTKASLTPSPQGSEPSWPVCCWADPRGPQAQSLPGPGTGWLTGSHVRAQHFLVSQAGQARRNRLRAGPPLPQPLPWVIFLCPADSSPSTPLGPSSRPRWRPSTTRAHWLCRCVPETLRHGSHCLLSQASCGFTLGAGPAHKDPLASEAGHVHTQSLPTQLALRDPWSLGKSGSARGCAHRSRSLHGHSQTPPEEMQASRPASSLLWASWGHSRDLSTGPHGPAPALVWELPGRAP